MSAASHLVWPAEFLALLLKYFARAHICVYQHTNGRLGAKLLGFAAALLTTTGRKTGQPHSHRRSIFATANGWSCPHPLAGGPAIRRGTATLRQMPRCRCKFAAST